MNTIIAGLDDTDMPGTPGTNKLALHIVRALADDFEGRLILRHQLLDDPRVPRTNRNGCASIQFRPTGGRTLAWLADRLVEIVRAWCPVGSDPGLCLAECVPDEVRHYGRRCQTDLVDQREARTLARRHGLFLEGLGGTEDGVIGALAAVGLLATADDGRVIFLGSPVDVAFEVGGPLSITSIRTRGVAEVRCNATGTIIDEGLVDLGKRLRPNYRGGRVVLFVEPVTGPARQGGAAWRAVRVT